MNNVFSFLLEFGRVDHNLGDGLVAGVSGERGSRQRGRRSGHGCVLVWRRVVEVGQRLGLNFRLRV